jgi:Zn-dependent M28 family amino/carboxypeptidase
MTLLTALAASLIGLAPPHEASIGANVDTARLMETISLLPTKRSGRGTPEHHAGLAEARDRLVEQLDALGYEPTLEEVFWKPPGRDDEDGEAPTWHNIIVDLPGTELPNEVLIFGAHYDAVYRAPGADDNGTGIAAIMEMARVLKDRPTKRTIRLIFFTLEEVGLVGSKQHAVAYKKKLDAGLEKPIGMVSLDMLGFYSDEPNSQESPIKPIKGVFEPPTVADFIGLATVAMHRQFSQRLNKEMLEGSPELKTIVVDFLPIPVPDMLRSDHAPFLAIGVPSVIMSDTANFRSPHYHQPTDTIDTIDTVRFTRVVQGLVHAAYMIAEPADDESSGTTDEH